MIDTEQIAKEIENVEKRRGSLKIQIDGLNAELDALKNRINALRGEYDSLSGWERALHYRYYAMTSALFPGDNTLDLD